MPSVLPAPARRICRAATPAQKYPPCARRSTRRGRPADGNMIAQPVPVQCLQRAPETFWISGLSILGSTQQTAQSPQSRPAINVMPSHIRASIAKAIKVFVRTAGPGIGGYAGMEHLAERLIIEIAQRAAEDVLGKFPLRQDVLIERIGQVGVVAPTRQIHQPEIAVIVDLGVAQPFAQVGALSREAAIEIAGGKMPCSATPAPADRPD